jgi:predicted nuclease of predicted toxin-antitoxin system
MRFLIDAQLPPSLVPAINRLGYEATHVFALQFSDASDRAIWEQAVGGGYVIVTKDEDFAIRRIAVDEGPAVLWIRRPNTRRAEMVVWLARLLPEAIMAFERGEKLVELG